MKRSAQYRHVDGVAAAALLALMLLSPAARADVTRTGHERWYERATPDAQQRARALFTQAVDSVRQFMREDARARFEQALELWDNPDIRWNLALVLEDLGHYLRAYQQLERASGWGEELGADRLRAVRHRMQVLLTQHLARIEASSDEPGADITLDGQPWFRGTGHASRLVEPGVHYVAAHKAGFFPVTRPIYVKAGQAARVALPMDADRPVKGPRWLAWLPWGVGGAGLAVTALGAAQERQAIAHRDAAARSLAVPCDAPGGGSPMRSLAAYDHAVRDGRIAITELVVGGTMVAAALTVAWFNQRRVHRTEARVPGPIELTPILSTDQAGVSARLRF